MSSRGYANVAVHGGHAGMGDEAGLIWEGTCQCCAGGDRIARLGCASGEG